jgi:hypothetical protein
MMKRITIAFAFAFMPTAAWSQCSSLPYTLTNGTVANADQVMADLRCAVLNGEGTVYSGLQITGSSIGINRNTATGVIYNSGKYAYQIQQLIDNPVQDRLSFQVYAGNGNGGPTPLIMDALGRVSINNNNVTNTSYTFYVNGTAAGNQGFANLSDERLKTNIRDIGNGLDTILSLRPVRFDWKNATQRTIGTKMALDPAAPQVGFIAQEVAKVIPEAVNAPTNADAPYSMIPTDIIPFLVQAIKEQQAQIKSLQDQVALVGRK